MGPVPLEPGLAAVVVQAAQQLAAQGSEADAGQRQVQRPDVSSADVSTRVLSGLLRLLLNFTAALESAVTMLLAMPSNWGSRGMRSLTLLLAGGPAA